jgi:hypothetical protein
VLESGLTHRLSQPARGDSRRHARKSADVDPEERLVGLETSGVRRVEVVSRGVVVWHPGIVGTGHRRDLNERAVADLALRFRWPVVQAGCGFAGTGWPGPMIDGSRVSRLGAGREQGLKPSPSTVSSATSFSARATSHAVDREDRCPLVRLSMIARTSSSISAPRRCSALLADLATEEDQLAC